MVTMRVLITTSISEEASSLDGGRRVRPRRLRLALLAGLTLALGQGAPALAHAAAGSVAAATPVTIQCGQDITASITVANDLTCPGSALTISADNVTVNLGGHAITGSGQGTGITLSPNSDEAAITGATVSNGTIENFGTAVFFDQAVDSTFDKVSLINDAAGDSPVFTTFVPGGMAHGVQITHSKILDTGGFITYADLETSQFSFTDTDIDTGEFYFSQTIGGPTFTDDHFTDVTLDLDIEGGTTVTGSSFDDSPVINNDNGFGYDTFENNTFTGAGTALTIATVGNQQLLDNTFTGNDIGAVISGSLGDTISGNTFTRNATAGVFYNDTTGAPPGTASTRATSRSRAASTCTCRTAEPPSPTITRRTTAATASSPRPRSAAPSTTRPAATYPPATSASATRSRSAPTTDAGPGLQPAAGAAGDVPPFPSQVGHHPPSAACVVRIVRIACIARGPEPALPTRPCGPTVATRRRHAPCSRGRRPPRSARRGAPRAPRAAAA
jgi:hypothetical protein